MNDKSLECIRFYDIQVNKMVKGRGGVILLQTGDADFFSSVQEMMGFI